MVVQTTVGQDRYVYVYLSNEEPYELQVGFDDYEADAKNMCGKTNLERTKKEV